MSRSDILSNIYTAIRADTALLALLGTVTSSNRRVYRGYPHVAPVLSSLEPAREGWLVVTEASGLVSSQQQQLHSIYEWTDVELRIMATAYALAQDVVSRLDQRYHWRIPQQQDVQYGVYLLLDTKRLTLMETYHDATHLYLTTATYRMTWVKETADV